MLRTKAVFISFFLASYSLSYSTYAADSSSMEDLSGLSIYDLSQIVVTSTSFYDQTLEQVPGSVYVVSSEKLSRAPVSNLAELLQFYVPGIHVGASEQYGPTIGTRGLQRSINSQTLVMFNGQSLNQHNFSGYTAGFLLPLLGDLQQVEIVKSPGAVVNGSGADAGYINLLPKNGRDNSGFFSRAEYGFVDNLKKAELGYGKNLGNQHDIFLYAGLVHADGYNFDDDFGALSDPDFKAVAGRLNNLNVGGFPRPSYKISGNYRNRDFSLTGLFQKVDFHPNSFVGRYDNDTAWHQTIFALSPKYRFKISPHESLELTGAVELTDFGIENRRTAPFLGNNVPAGDEGGSEGHYELKMILTSNRLDKHRLAFGFLLGYRKFDDGGQFFSSTPSAPHLSATNGSWDEYAFFIEDIIDINKSTSLTLGLRYDRIDYSTIGSSFFSNNAGAPESFSIEDADNTSFRAAIFHRLSAYSNIKLSYQTGFHYPDAAQFIENGFFSSQLVALGESPLPEPKPQSTESFEVDLEHFSPKNRLKTNISFYYNRHKDTLLFLNLRGANDRFSQSAIDTIVARNFYFGGFLNLEEDFGALGTEISFTWRPTAEFTGNLSYGYSQPTGVEISPSVFSRPSFISTDGDTWTAFPTHQFKASFDYQWQKWKLNLGGIYESAVRSAPPGVTDLSIDKAYIRINGLLDYQLSMRSSLYLMAKNIFANDTPPVSFVNSRPFNGNLGSDERLIYLGFRYEY